MGEGSSGTGHVEAAYDPWAGMDRNGRIPAVDRPEALPNPERWRYIPEGRIKPGNVFNRILVSSFVLPFVFRDSDVGTGLGIALTDVDFRLQRRREFLGTFLSYTTKGQQNYTLVWRRWMHHIDLPGGGVLQEERSFFRGKAGYSKALTRRFFGLGPKTRESDETSYTDERWAFEFGAKRSLPQPGSDFVAGVALRGEFHELSGGEVGGKPDTGDVFTDLFENAEDANLGWLIASASWDTRDSQVNPYRGWELTGQLWAALAQNDGDVGAIYRFSGSRAFRVPGLFHDGADGNEENPPTDVLAFRFRIEHSSGDLPFFVLPTLGGADSMRGYIDGRFYDDASWLAAGEYRFWIVPRGFRVPFTEAVRVERLGAALFYELGAVASDPGAFFDARVRHSYGIGFRLTLERTAPFRLDLGFSEDGMEVSAGFGFTF